MRIGRVLAPLGAVRLAVSLAIEPRQGGKPDSPEQLERFAQLAFSAYCPAMHDGGSGTAVCTDKQGQPCPGFEGVQSSVEFEGKGKNAVGGYVASDPANQRVVVAFKGTDSLNDIITDIKLGQVDSDLCDGCKLHEGFSKGFDQLQQQIEDGVAAELAKPGQERFRVAVTGHSLGAAVGTIAGASLRARQRLPVDMYLYGSPLVGNAAFADFVAGQDGFTGRVTNAADPVTAVPKVGGVPPQRYQHLFPETFFENGLEAPELYAAAPPRVCADADDCSSADCLDRGGLLFGCKLRDHTLYAGGPAYTPCDGEPDPFGKLVGGLLGALDGGGKSKAGKSKTGKGKAKGNGKGKGRGKGRNKGN